MQSMTVMKEKRLLTVNDFGGTAAASRFTSGLTLACAALSARLGD
jgi:hypothetical protein